MPVGQISNPYGAYGSTGSGAGFEGALSVEAQTRSTDVDPASAGSTDGKFRTIQPGMVVTPTFPSSSFYPQGLAIAAATGPLQLPFGIAGERIEAFWGTTGSTGLNSSPARTRNDQAGQVIIYGVAYAMFASTAHPGAGDVTIPSYAVIATSSQSLFAASCHFGLLALSSSITSLSTIGGSTASDIGPTSLQNGPLNVIGIAFTSQGGMNAYPGYSTGPQLYPIIVKAGP